MGQLSGDRLRRTDPLTGKERYLRETAATYAGAERALARLQTQVDEERHPKTAITVRQAITQWLDVAELQDTPASATTT